MKMITRRGIFLWILSALFVAGIVFMTLSLVHNGDEWVMKRFNHHVYSNGELVGAGTIYDIDGDVLAQTKDGERLYSDSITTRKSTLHVVGDRKNFISTGVQSVYDAKLTGYSLLFGVYNIERYGTGNDMTLTIDKDICDAAYEALNGKKGTVGIVNYKTGDIICSVSSPSYDPEDIPYDLETNEAYEGVYINRLISAHYVPGSTFKIVTAICALENMDDALSRKWVCEGKYQPEKGVAITCEGYHGKIGLEEAFAKSCNAVFAQIAIELGAEKLEATAKELGIGSSVSIGGAINSFGGTFNLEGIAADKLGWTGIGQGDTRLAPITMLRIASAIANGGSVPSFNIVSGIANRAGSALNITLPANTTTLINSETADKIGRLMANNGKVQYSDVVDKSLHVCAKTGTAQIDEIDAHNIAWFVGYMDDDEYPYAFVVTVENGGSGHYSAAPIANKVLKAIKNK